MLKWYMPVITQNEAMKFRLLSSIQSKEKVDLSFMNKTITQFTDLAGVTQYTASLSFSSGIEKPRYLVAAFQVQDVTAPGGTNTQNINYSVFNETTATTMVDIDYVDLRVNGQLYRLTDSGNTWSANKYARWYNKFKKFRSSYLGDFSDDECISFTDFRNI